MYPDDLLIQFYLLILCEFEQVFEIYLVSVAYLLNGAVNLWMLLYSLLYSHFLTWLQSTNCKAVTRLKLSNNETKNIPAQFSLAFYILTLTWIENVSLKVSISFMLV